MLKQILVIILFLGLSVALKPFPLRRIGKINSHLDVPTNADYITRYFNL